LGALLAYGTGTGGPDLRARNEYLAAEKPHPEGPAEMSTEALGRRASHALMSSPGVERFSPRSQPSAQPDTHPSWYRNLVAHKFRCSTSRLVKGPGNRGQLLGGANSSSGWQRETGTGATTGLRWPCQSRMVISDQTVGIVCYDTACAVAGARANDPHGSVFIRTHFRGWQEPTLHRRGANAARVW